MSIKLIGRTLFLLITTTACTLVVAQHSADFIDVPQLNSFIDAVEKNPQGITDKDFKKMTPLVMAAAQSDNLAIKRAGVGLLQAVIRYDVHFNQFSQALEVVRAAIKNTDTQIRALSSITLQEIVFRYTKIDEIKEEVLRIARTAIKSPDAFEKREGFGLYVALINRDKEFNQFDKLALDIDEAMQSSDKQVQAWGIWLLYKHIKRNPRFDDFTKAHAVAKIGMADAHEGMRCHTLALLAALIHKESLCYEIPAVRHFAITEARRALATKGTIKERNRDAFFTNSLALLSQLMDCAIEFEKDEYATIEQPALCGVKLKDAKACSNSLKMLQRLVEKRMATVSLAQLTTIALQATQSKMPRVLNSSLLLLRRLLQHETGFIRFEDSEKAALQCAVYDNTWVRCEPLELLIELLKKDKLTNLTTAEYVAQRSAHSSNDEEYRAGKDLLNSIVRKKRHKVLVSWLLVFAPVGLGCLVAYGVWHWRRNRRVRW